MLQILGYLLLIVIAILLIKFGVYILLSCCIGGILSFIWVGAITGALAIFGVISADTAWTISKWAFYIGTAITTIRTILHPIDTISDAWREATSSSSSGSSSYSSSSDSSSSNDNYDEYRGMRCCANCRWNASLYPNNVICNHMQGDAVSVTGCCSDYCER